MISRKPGFQFSLNHFLFNRSIIFYRGHKVVFSLVRQEGLCYKKKTPSGAGDSSDGDRTAPGKHLKEAQP